jgi:Fe-S-cluster-containing dehydrogenase component
VHEAVHRLNAVLGNLGTIVTFAEPVLPEAETVNGLVEAMAAGEVSTLLMLDANPVYTALSDIGFANALAKVKTKIHAGLYVDETALRCDWHLPLTHPLEGWGDARAVDGTASLIQPTVKPLYDGRSAAEILSLLFDGDARGGLAIVRAHWQGAQEAAAYEPIWRTALLDGFLPGTAAPKVTPPAVAPRPADAPGAPLDLRPDTVTLLFRPDPTIWDGSLAASGWLQELPKPLTKIVWENVAAISPALAQQHQLANGDVVTLSLDDRRLDVPVWIVPGQAARTMTLTLGYGRLVTDTIFDALGYDANMMRAATSPWLTEGVTLAKTGRKAVIATTQDHNSMEGHDFIRVARQGDAPQRQGEGARPSLYGGTDKPKDERAWGMVIDTDRCTGCNACVVACQSENNIAVVGKEQVALGRGMHWLRVDRYYSSAKTEGNGVDDPDTHFQPVPCMQCEMAPCEVGCPVEATLHDSEGLNLMVYNRCVGTRACSGYCPYKVRRFNYLDYSGGVAPSIKSGRNPDVSVRSRGVMEKCTYCVQRVAEARITSDKTGEPIKDGTVETACQSACPTRAITFGDLADSTSAVAAKRRDSRNYDLLGELNLRPRTTYLAERAPRQPAKEG